MSLYSRILYAVKDTDPRHSGVFDKVVALAKACDARLDLFHAVSSPLFLPERPDEATIDDLKRDTLDLHRARLDQLAERAQRHGIRTTCTVAWDHPADEAIIRHADETRASLVVAQCHEGRGKGWLMRLTDWELVRKCDVPVLLMRDRLPWRKPTILAAVDPMRAHGKPLELDENILAGGRALAAILRGKLHIVHANFPSLTSLAMEAPYAANDLRTLGQEEFARLMRRADMATRRGHLLDGDPARVIPRVADDLDASIVVMGAVSRSGLQRLFIGNTAERVLGKLSCDVLVVKPDAFRRRVSAEHSDAVVLAPAPSTATA